MQSDTKYLCRRAHEERHAAGQSSDLRVRAKHLELAEAYELRLREIHAQDLRPAFVFVPAGPFVDTPEFLLNGQLQG